MLHLSRFGHQLIWQPQADLGNQRDDHQHDQQAHDEWNARARQLTVRHLGNRDQDEEPDSDGGCMIPIIRLKMTTTPKCVGSTPISSAVGISSGTAISIAGSVSMKNPSTSSSRLANSRKLTFPADSDAISCDS